MDLEFLNYEPCLICMGHKNFLIHIEHFKVEHYFKSFYSVTFTHDSYMKDIQNSYKSFFFQSMLNILRNEVQSSAYNKITSFL